MKSLLKGLFLQVFLSSFAGFAQPGTSVFITLSGTGRESESKLLGQQQ